MLLWYRGAAGRWACGAWNLLGGMAERCTAQKTPLGRREGRFLQRSLSVLGCPVSAVVLPSFDFLTPSKPDFLLVNIKHVFNSKIGGGFNANLDEFTDSNGCDAECFQCSVYCAF